MPNIDCRGPNNQISWKSSTNILKYDNKNTIKLLIDTVAISKECVINNQLTVENGLPWIMIFGHQWGDWTMLFTNDLDMCENHWRITCWVNKTRYYIRCFILHTLYALNRQENDKNTYGSPILPLFSGTPNSNWVLWFRSHGRDALARWRQPSKVFVKA